MAYRRLLFFMKTRSVLRAAALLASIALPMAAGSITTTFGGTNGFTGNMFDATIGSNTITVNSLGVDVSTAPVTIDVYVKTGSYVGFETTPAAWTLVSATAVTGLGQGVSTNVTVTPFSLTKGTTYGIYVTASTTATTMYYTNGNNVYSNADLSLSLGEGLGGVFGSSGLFPGRTWDGTINYTLASVVPEPASLTLFALAVPGLWLAGRKRYLRKY
jgi:hypothetical protein